MSAPDARAAPRRDALSAASTSAPASRATGCSCSSSALVGGSGYVVNLAVFALAQRRRSACTTSPPRCSPSASRSSTTSGWNRHWTFGAGDGHAGLPGGALLRRQPVGLGLNLALLELLRHRRRAARARRRRRSRWRSRCRSTSSATSCGRSAPSRRARASLASPADRSPALAATATRCRSTTPTAPVAPELLPADARGLRGHRARRARRSPTRPRGGRADGQPRPARRRRSRSTTTGVWQVGYKDGDDEVVQVKVDDRTRGGPRGVDRLPGRLADGARLRGPVRPRAQRALRLDPARADLPRRPVRLPPAAAGSPTSTCSSLLVVRGLARLLQPRRDRRLGAARLPAARSTCSARMLWIGFRGGEGLRPSLPVRWLGARRGRPDRLPARRSTSPTRG